MTTTPASPLLRVLDNPYVLLVFTTLFWSGNSVAGRLIAPEASPLMVTALRWLMTSALLATFALPRLKADWPLLKPHLVRLGLLGTSGYTAFNALFYAAAHTTTAINISILQGAIPIFVFLIAVMLGQRLGLAQVVGLVLGLFGVVAVATDLEPERLAHFTFKLGDVFILAASLLYAVYTLMLRNRPKVAAMSLFAVMAFAATLTSLPLAAAEIWTGGAHWPTPKGWLIMGYITLGPSFLSQLFFMRAVAQIGPERAGLWTNLVPVLGAMMGTFIGETLGLAQVIGLVLVVGGILWAEKMK